jgi:hypothetical protein
MQDYEILNNLIIENSTTLQKLVFGRRNQLGNEFTRQPRAHATLISNYPWTWWENTKEGNHGM